HAAHELLDAVGGRDARRLRKLAHADEALWKERADAMDHVVHGARPVSARRLVADVMRHAARARREERQVHAPLTLDAKLVLLDRLADLVVADFEVGRERAPFRERRDLALAPVDEAFG